MGVPLTKGELMRRRNLTLLALAIGSLAQVNAANAESGNKLTSSIGAEAFYSRYEEPGLMENEGWMYGVSYEVDYQYSPSWSLLFDGLIATGQVDYTSESTGSMDGQDNFMTDNRLMFGHSIVDGGTATLYYGIGYRYLVNDSAYMQTTTDHWGYTRRSNYIYSPIGVNFKLADSGAWQVSSTLEYDYFWYGKQVSELGYLGYSDIENEQHNGYGFRFSLAIEKQLASGKSLRIEPFYRYWDISDSETVSLGNNVIAWEPANTTQEIGLNISFRY